VEAARQGKVDTVFLRRRRAPGTQVGERIKKKGFAELRALGEGEKVCWVFPSIAKEKTCGFRGFVVGGGGNSCLQHKKGETR